MTTAMATTATAAPKLTGKQRAAVLLIALGPEASANVLRKLRESEIEQLAMEVFATEQVSEDVRREVLADCFQMALVNGYLSTGGSAYAQDMLSLALGHDRAQEILIRVVASTRRRHFEFLKDTDPVHLVTFIQEEQPQTIALILSHLPTPMASKVLASLPADVRAEVAMRIATMERTPPEVIENVEQVLRRRLSSVIETDYSSAGGVEHLAQLLMLVDRSTERVILEYLDEKGLDLAEEVRKLAFVFDNIIQLDDSSIQRVLREVDAKVLALALRGVSDELREKILRNLSARAAEMLREDMAVSGPVRLAQVEEAQQQIVGIVRRLEEGGVLGIGRGGDDILV